MLKCRDVASGLTDYLERRDGILRRVRFRFHLILCRGCRCHADKTRALILALRRLPGDEDIPPEVMETWRAWRH